MMMLTALTPLKHYFANAPVLLLVLATLATHMRYVMSDLTEGVITMEGPDMHLIPISGGDVIANNVSITSLSATVSTVKAEINVIKAESSAALSDVASLTAESNSIKESLSTLAAQFSTFVSQANATTTPNSICLISPSPQNLSKAFQTFDTFTSADGTMYLIGEQNTQSVVFKYDGNSTFVSHQLLWSPVTANFADKVCAFKVDSVQYVAMPFLSDGITYDYRCELYRFDEATRLLVSIQNISTMGVVGVSVMTAQNGATYLALSNNYNQAASFSISSYIMRYNNATKLFEHYRNVTTSGAMPPEFYQIRSDTFLAIPNNYNESTSSLVNSVIYKLDTTSGNFVLNQSIPTNGGSHLKPWIRNLSQYLSVVNQAGNYVDVYRFDSTQGQFVNVSSGSRLFASNPNGADLIDIAGSTYMAVSSGGSFALIYKWNDALTQFEQTQQFTVTSGWLFPHFFTIAADTFLALSDRIYKFCGGQFVIA
jgi:hypothetical protein